MPGFDIIKKCDIEKTYRIARIMGDYDVKFDHAQEHFRGNIDLPEDWQIGVIWGGSGTGKTTIARELFGDQLITGFEYNAKSVVDDMPKNCDMAEIEKMFYSVGFGSVPSWMKPYSVLSNGEKNARRSGPGVAREGFRCFRRIHLGCRPSGSANRIFGNQQSDQTFTETFYRGFLPF